MIARQFRLREEADVRRVRSRGKAWANGPLVARILPNNLEPAQNRYTVIAGKKCGKAVQRNRLKRVTREALRGFHPFLQPGYDIAIICRGTLEEMSGLADAQQALARIFTRAALFMTPDGAGSPEIGAPIATGWRLTPSASRNPDDDPPTAR